MHAHSCSLTHVHAAYDHSWIITFFLFLLIFNNVDFHRELNLICLCFASVYIQTLSVLVSYEESKLIFQLQVFLFIMDTIIIMAIMTFEESDHAPL